MGKKIDKKIVKQNIWIPPKRCPIMSECKEDVDWDTFEGFCNTESWIFCEHTEELAKKYKRKPYEWKLVKELGGFPCEKVNPGRRR